MYLFRTDDTTIGKVAAGLGYSESYVRKVADAEKLGRRDASGRRLFTRTEVSQLVSVLAAVTDRVSDVK